MLLLTSVSFFDDSGSLAPKLARGMELVYRGSCVHSAQGDGLSSRRTWDLETRAFVLETQPARCEVALLTTLRDTAGAASTRFTLVDVAEQGLARSKGESLVIPLDGPAPLDGMAFFDRPTGPLTIGQSWERNELDRPPRRWTIVGAESPEGGLRCLKLVGEQKTPRWDELNEHRAWRRVDTVWLDPRTGLVVRLERTIDVRDPQSRAVTQSVTTTYSLESNLTYPGRFDAEIRKVILAAWQYSRTIGEWSASGSRDPRPLDVLTRRMNYQREQFATSGWRDVFAAVERQLEIARTHETAPTITLLSATTAAVAVGEMAPEFVASNIVTHEPTRLGRFDGATLLVFFRHDSTSASESLRAADHVRERFGSRIRVAALCVASPNDLSLQANYPRLDYYDGRDARIRYAAESTPRFVVIDAGGRIRLVLDGYGSEAAELMARAVESAGSPR